MSQSELVSLFPEAGSIPADSALDFPIQQTEYLVGGTIRTWKGPFQEIVSPVQTRSNGSISRTVIGSVPELTAEAAFVALEAASAAYDRGRGQWPTMSVGERIRHMEDFTRRLKERRDEVIRLIMWEIAKTRNDATKEFDRTVDYIVATIEALKDLDRDSSRFMIQEGIIGQVRRSPLGIVLCMGPYNYPLNETFATLIPALIMGNTCILKPPKYGVLLYKPLLEAFKEAFPSGVINVIYGDGQTIITPIMESGRIDVLAFIGSSEVADILKKGHPHPHRLKGVLGMGAKNAGIVLAGAEIDQAVKECLLGSLSYNGQRCTALKILFVHKSIVDIFIERYLEALAELKPGMPWVDGVGITPLPVEDMPDYLDELVKDAVAKGAKVINPGGGERAGSMFRPAVLYPVNESMRVYHEEQFGPVVPIVPFDDLDHPVRYVYDSRFGQQVSLFGTDANVLAVLVDPMVNQVSRVNINSQCQRGPDTFPFTGRKGSAEGTLSVTDALRSFSIRTLVAAKKNDLNDSIITDIVHDHKSNFLSTDFIL